MNRYGYKFHLCARLSLVTFSPSRSHEYPDCKEIADSDVADIIELEKLDIPEAGLENRPEAWLSKPSSNQEQDDSGLVLLLSVEQEVFPLTTMEPKSKNLINDQLNSEQNCVSYYSYCSICVPKGKTVACLCVCVFTHSYCACLHYDDCSHRPSSRETEI